MFVAHILAQRKMNVCKEHKSDFGPTFSAKWNGVLKVSLWKEGHVKGATQWIIAVGLEIEQTFPSPGGFGLR